MSDSKELTNNADAAPRPMCCSTVLEAIAEAKAEIQAAFDEANRPHQTERNQSFYEGQHHAYKYAFLVLGQLEWKVVSELDQQNGGDQRVAKGDLTMSKDADRDSVASHCSSAIAEGLAARHERERVEGLRVALDACVCGCPRSQHAVGPCETRGCKCMDYRRPWRLTGRNALWYVVESPDGSEFRMADEDSAKRLVCKMNFGSER